MQEMREPAGRVREHDRYHRHFADHRHYWELAYDTMTLLHSRTLASPRGRGAWTPAPFTYHCVLIARRASSSSGTRRSRTGWCVSAALRLCVRLLLRAFRRPDSRRSPRRPCPAEVVAADRPEAVQDLAAEEESGRDAALQRARVHLAQRHAAAGDLGLLVALVARPRQAVARELLHQPRALLAAELGKGARVVDPGLGQQGVGQAGREMAAEERQHRPRQALQQQALPR